MNLGQIRELTLDWLDDPNAGYFTTSIMNRRINLAQKELQKKLLQGNALYYMLCVKTNTVIDQALYSLPSDFYQLNRLARVESGSGETASTKQIYPMAPNQKDLNLEESGDPRNYWWQGDFIHMWPVPDRVQEIRLFYSRKVVDMSADGDEADAPDQFHEFIPILAARDGFLKDGRPLDPIQLKLKEFEKLLDEIKTQRENSHPRMVIATTGGFGDF